MEKICIFGYSFNGTKKIKMKTALIGFGRAGKAVASVILTNPDFKLEWILRKRPSLTGRSASEVLGIESDDPGKVISASGVDMEKILDENPVDVIIDFSSEEGIHRYGKAAASKGIRIISAISHYGDSEKSLLRELSKETVVFWSPNITLGINYLMFASRFLRKIAPWVDIEIIEQHFKTKDGISGTAVKLAEALDVKPADINVVRAGGIVGKHEVIFGFPYQTVRLIHESISREAFGNGAIFVAQNLRDKPKGLYNFEDLLHPYFNDHLN